MVRERCELHALDVRTASCIPRAAVRRHLDIGR
jgi:hypothetical protein